MNVRKSDLMVILASVAAAAVAAAAIDTLFIEPALVEVTRFDLPLPDLPEAWEGARMIHLTDLHYGNPRSQRLFDWMVKTVNAAAADLVVITGDYIVEEPWEGVAAAKYLAQLRAKHGVVGVMGDHDFVLKTKEPVQGVIEQIREAGVTLLRNEAVELPGGLKIAGVDPTTRKVRHADLNAALAAVPGGKPHLLLSHAPDIIPKAADRGVPMVLCGHTHGGQVVIPGYGPPVTHSQVGREFASGWSKLQETRMYTGRGLSSHYSLRFCCRPEVTIFTLRRA